VNSSLGMWWWRPKGFTNFGDELGPAILARLGRRVRRVPVGDAELVACGSILHMLTNPATAVWGSGMMRPGRLPVKPKRVLALRGRNTAARLGIDGVPLGDPGLLVSALWDRPKVRHRLGVVPHYVDTRTWPEADLVIDVRQPVDAVIAAIGSCSAIASSSLHGLIAAQSYGIPAMRLPHPRVGGGDFKWIDHISAVDRPIDQIQKQLVEALP
jgi:pyruvyltransferase